MQLTRATISVPSQIMLPAYVVFFGVVGGNFAIGETPRLFQSPMLRYANHLMSIRVWGCLFLACSLIMLIALIVHNRYLYRYGLLVCCLSMLTWAGVAIVGAFSEPVSFSAWAWPALAAVACWASNKSLERNSAEDHRRQED